MLVVRLDFDIAARGLRVVVRHTLTRTRLPLRSTSLMESLFERDMLRVLCGGKVKFDLLEVARARYVGGMGMRQLLFELIDKGCWILTLKRLQSLTWEVSNVLCWVVLGLCHTLIRGARWGELRSHRMRSRLT